MTKKVNLMTDANSIVSTVNEAVSQRIKLYRKQKKISLDELSRRAGVSKGALVEIEGCRANPSIALLCRLTAAMGVSVADFVDVSSKPTVHLIAEDEIPELWEGEKGGRARLLAGSGWPRDDRALDVGNAAGGKGLGVALPYGRDAELFYVQTGALTLGVQDHLYLVKTGCSATARTDVPHFYENREEGPLVFIMTVHEKAS